MMIKKLFPDFRTYSIYVVQKSLVSWLMITQNFEKENEGKVI